MDTTPGLTARGWLKGTRHRRAPVRGVTIGRPRIRHSGQRRSRRTEQGRQPPRVRPAERRRSPAFRAIRRIQRSRRSLQGQRQLLQHRVGRHRWRQFRRGRAFRRRHALRRFLATQQKRHVHRETLLMGERSRLGQPRQHRIRRGLRTVRTHPRRDQQPERPPRGRRWGNASHDRELIRCRSSDGCDFFRVGCRSAGLQPGMPHPDAELELGAPTAPPPVALTIPASAL